MGLKKYSIKNNSDENIEAEEIFLDAEAIRSLEDKGKLEQPIKARNFILFYILIVSALFALFIRTGYLQIIKGEYYRNLAEGNRIKTYSLAAPRGIIYDRYGDPLVYNVPAFDLRVNLADFLVNSASVQEEILKEISVILRENQEKNSLARSEEKIPKAGNKSEEFKKKIKEAQGKTAQVVLVKNIEQSAALVLESLVSEWPGVRLVRNIHRQYILGENEAPILSHVLGYTGEINSADLGSQFSYGPDDEIGKTGLELQYEELLRGEAGKEEIEVDVFGQSRKFLALKPSEPGQSLGLFIDKGLQDKLYQSLNRIIGQISAPGGKVTKAAAVVVDVKNGGILALVSFPAFDNNIFSQGISSADYDVLIKNPDQPLFNRAIAGQYPPGSIIKPLIGSAALEERIVSPSQKINDSQGEISVVNPYNPQVVYTFSDWKIHGLTDIIKAIAESCNVYFYTVGGGYGNIDGLGIYRIKKYLQLFGLGELTDIDLPFEEDGLIPDENWKEETKKEKWYIGDTYHASIGQGDIMVTPLQMALATAAIANNGILYQPQIVDKIMDSEKNTIKDIEPKIIRENFISSENLAIVRKGMRESVISGSVQALGTLPVRAAGKTGTAQFGVSDKTHAWFTGFAPYENPEIALAVVVEGGGEGHRAAVPVAKEVFEWWFSQP